MTKSQSTRIVAASVIAAVCLVPSALANPNDPSGAGQVISPASGAVGYTLVTTSALAGQGEEKNGAPFTTPVQGDASSGPASVSRPFGQGEAKNGAPFTARYQEDPGLAVAYAKVETLQASAGESTSTPSFTASAGSPGSGFSWIDASIGSVAALGGCLLAAGAIGLRRRAAVTVHGFRPEHV